MTDRHPETITTDDTATAERDYLLKRADDHRRLALRAVEANIRAAHLLMQQLYEKRAHDPALIHPD